MDTLFLSLSHTHTHTHARTHTHAHTDAHTHTHKHTHTNTILTLTLEETCVCLASGQVSGWCQPSEQQADMRLTHYKSQIHDFSSGSHSTACASMQQRIQHGHIILYKCSNVQVNTSIKYVLVDYTDDNY